MSVEQISPQKAFELLKNQKNSVLIDVRTNEELNFVGIVDASSFDNRMILINPLDRYQRHLLAVTLI